MVLTRKALASTYIYMPRNVFKIYLEYIELEDRGLNEYIEEEAESAASEISSAVTFSNKFPS